MLRYQKATYVLTQISLVEDRWSILLMVKVGHKFELAEVVYDGIGKDAAIEIFEELTNKQSKERQL